MLNIGWYIFLIITVLDLHVRSKSSRLGYPGKTSGCHPVKYGLHRKLLQATFLMFLGGLPMSNKTAPPVASPRAVSSPKPDIVPHISVDSAWSFCDLEIKSTQYQGSVADFFYGSPSVYLEEHVLVVLLLEPGPSRKPVIASLIYLPSHVVPALVFFIST